MPEYPEQQIDEISLRDHYKLYHISCKHAYTVLSYPLNIEMEDFENALVTVKILMLVKGVPKECARIYRLPDDQNQREKWLSLADAVKQKV